MGEDDNSPEKRHIRWYADLHMRSYADITRQARSAVSARRVQGARRGGGTFRGRRRGRAWRRFFEQDLIPPRASAVSSSVQVLCGPPGVALVRLRHAGAAPVVRRPNSVHLATEHPLQ